jgi:hypothetical protein
MLVLAIGLAAIGLVLLFPRFIAKAVYILLCALVGIPFGLFLGVLDYFKLDRSTIHAQRQQRIVLYKRVAVGFVIALRTLILQFPGIGIARKSYAVSKKVLFVTGFSPRSKYTVWSPVRSLFTWWKNCVVTGYKHPYQTVRSFSYGVRIARFFRFK